MTEPDATAGGLSLGVLLLAAVLAFAFQGSRGLWSPDEGRYTNVALEMLDSGDWLRPHLNHEEAHFTKPPLTYWVLAASIGTLGRSEWAARLPNALAFLFTTGLVLVLGRRFVPERPWLPALIYASFVLPNLAANVVTTDTLLALWETAAMAAFVASGLLDGAAGHRRWAVRLMWLAFGLAFLTKGPPGLLPLLAVVPWVAHRSGWAGVRALFPLSGLALFLLVGVSWYVVVVWRTPGLGHYFLYDEFLARIASGRHARSAQWYGGLAVYVPTLLVGSLPWGLAWLVVRLRRTGPAMKQDAMPQAGDGRFLLAWLLVPLAVFLLARSRLVLYLLPLFVPLALLLARDIGRSLDVRARWIRVLAAVTVVALIGLRWFASTMESPQDDRRLAAMLGRFEVGDEVVYIDEKPRYGLNFYLGTDVERVCLLKDCSEETGFQKNQDLDAELQEDERRLFAVPSDRRAAFEEALGQHGLVARELARDARMVYLRAVPRATAP